LETPNKVRLNKHGLKKCPEEKGTQKHLFRVFAFSSKINSYL
jgi:hypothetical protein